MDTQDLIKSLVEKDYLPASKTLPVPFDVSDYLDRHDIVYLTPPRAGYEGLPLGNGDISLMLWPTETGLTMQINKNDTWTQPDEEAPMLLRSCARATLNFAQPVNDWLYLDDFEMRLHLGRGKVTYRAKTPFATIEATVFVDPDTNLIVIDLLSSQDQAHMHKLSLERYGSRAFSYWYSGIKRGASYGLGQAEAGAAGQMIYLQENFTADSNLDLSVVAHVSSPVIRAEKISQRQAEICWTPGRVTILLAVAVQGAATSKQPLPLKDSPAPPDLPGQQKDSFQTASKLVEYGQQKLDRIRRRHEAWWKSYWNRSFIHLSRAGEEEVFDYLENLYYMQFYALAIASRGSYPMIFNGGAFTWNRDVRQWVNPHHWNIQQSYWSPETANRPELLEPYLAAYERIMPAAREFAREHKKVKRGLAISEKHDFAGRMISFLGALTPASQIGQQFWNHYLYNQDQDYLAKRAFPYLSECADFYVEYAVFNPASGCYDIKPAAVYECEQGEDFTNTVVDLVMVRYILTTAIKAAAILNTAAERVQIWQDFLSKVSDFIYLDEEPETLAMALDTAGNKVSFKSGHKTINQNTTFCRNAAPLMPCPIIGLSDKGTRLYQAVYNAALEYKRQSLAIVPISVIWARLGEGERALSFLLASIAQLQHFPQGFFYNIDHWYQYSRYAERVDDYLVYCQRDYINDHALLYENIALADVAPPANVNIPMQPFIQPGFETAAILVHAVHEMLLQSHEGVVRLLPACPPDLSGMFTLRAAGGFMISCQIKDGSMLPLVFITSQHGQVLKIELPFAAPGLILCDASGQEVPFAKEDETTIRFTTKPQSSYILAAADLSLAEIRPMQPDYKVNQGSKQYGVASLGRARQF